MDYLLITAGLVLLFVGGEALVRGSVVLAERLNISKLLIGMVVVGFGTSTPELLVSLKALWANTPEIAVGNVVGSNIANILLILGVGACIMPLANGTAEVRRDAWMMVLVTLLLWVGSAQGFIPMWLGWLMMALLASYITLVYLAERKAQTLHTLQTEDHETPTIPFWLAIPMVLVGIAVLVVGADWLVAGASSLARSMGVSEAVIGLTLVAVGTSLPELAATIVSAYRKHADVVLGNVLGSNIFNILMILGVTSAITPLPIAHGFMVRDIPLALATALGLTLWLVFRQGRLGRTSGLIMLALYGGYIAWLAITPS